MNIFTLKKRGKEKEQKHRACFVLLLKFRICGHVTNLQGQDFWICAFSLVEYHLTLRWEQKEKATWEGKDVLWVCSRWYAVYSCGIIYPLHRLHLPLLLRLLTHHSSKSPIERFDRNSLSFLSLTPPTSSLLFLCYW